MSAPQVPPLPPTELAALRAEWVDAERERLAEREALDAWGPTVAKWEQQLPAPPTREQRDAAWRTAMRAGLRQTIPGLADCGFIDFSVGAAVAL